MMKKKGFTLVELLAVIVILGVILVLAIPKISDSIKIARTEAFIKDEEELVKATESFLARNVNYIPQNVGDTKEVKLHDLQSGSFINTVVNPNDNKKTCNGYILVTKLGDKKFNYVPHLNCEENIGSAEDDGLVAHYTFDDFEEPTENLYASYGDLSKARVLYTIDGNNTLSYGDNTLYNKEQNYVERVIKSNAAPSGHASYRHCFSSVEVGKNFTISYKVKILSGDINSIGVHLNGTTYALTPKYKDNDGWYHFEKNATTISTGLCVGIGFRGTTSLDALITEPQVEFKDHATPFVNGVRIGIVKDYSLNDNNATLQLDSTPKWVSDSAIGDGAYQFDGVDDYMDSGNNSSFMPTSITVSGWIKFNDTETGSWMMVNKAFGGTPGSYYIYSNLPTKAIWSIYGPTGTLYNASFLTTFEKGKWYYLVGTFDASSSKMKTYVNGELKETVSGAALGSNTDNVLIGKYTSGYYLDGLIDDLRIYSRALSDEEIKHYYDIESYKMNK